MPHTPNPGAPKFRKNYVPPVPVKPVNLADLVGLTAAELKEIAERDALRALIAQVRKPTRHAQAVVGAARNLLDFSSRKPAEEHKHDVSGNLEIVVTRVAE